MKRKTYKSKIAFHNTKKIDTIYFDDPLDMFGYFFKNMTSEVNEFKEVTIEKLKGKKYTKFLYAWLSEKEKIVFDPPVIHLQPNPNFNYKNLKFVNHKKGLK